MDSPLPAPPPATPMTGSTSPAAVRPQMGGQQQKGRVLASLGLKCLAEALRDLGEMSPEGQDVISMLKIGGKHFGTPSPDIMKAEAKLLGDKANPMGTPDNPMAMQQAIRSKLGAMGVGGGGGPQAQPAAPAAPPAAMPGAA